MNVQKPYFSYHFAWIMAIQMKYEEIQNDKRSLIRNDDFKEILGSLLESSYLLKDLLCFYTKGKMLQKLTDSFNE